MHLTWFDRAGERLATVGRPGAYLAPVLSPDETRVAVGRDGDIWVLDIVRGGEARLIANAAWPVWSPTDAKSCLLGVGTSLRKTPAAPAWRKSCSKATRFQSGGQQTGNSSPIARWAPARSWICMFSHGGAAKGAALSSKSVPGRGEPVVARREEMASVSFDSATPEVYVQTFPPSQERWQVSTAGGRQPTWRADGRELFYLGLDGKLMAVDIEMTSHFRAGVPRPLFQVASIFGPVRNSYAPSRSGRRFLVNSYAEPMASTIVVLLKWPAALPN